MRGGNWTGSPPRRCGVTSVGGALGCCRVLDHDGDHCGHPTDALTGSPGVLRFGTHTGRRVTPLAPGPGVTGKEADLLRRFYREDDRP